ncbi:OLC1v1026236C1 [Oldenlandia corymbosa var. corymbosa]|nr:OLC1v1026236C1 [Oldenlandia corymbosa var. corymbosa]
MPTGLYYTMDHEMGARIVGLLDRFVVIDNSTALELIERLNTGASSISPVEDLGLFRRWNGDDNHFLETGVDRASLSAHSIVYTSTRAYYAPPKVYQTSWKLKPNIEVQEVYTFRWRIPIDIGFGYLIRLHYYDSDPSFRTGGGKNEFSVLMNGHIAETKVDILSWSGGSGIPVHRDYVVMVKGDKQSGNSDLLIDLRSTNGLVAGLLSGLEIFKLSNPDNSLAAPNRVSQRRMSFSWKQKIHTLFSLSKSNAVMTGIIILLVLVNALVYYLRQTWGPSVHKGEALPLLSIDPSFRCFSLYEILLVTENFSDAFLIGRGGFGKVYKGFISSISQVVAIKRLNANSKQGPREFWAEVETLSKFRHIHLVSLIGYCNEGSEMILVYEYMPCGTLADNIYKFAKNGQDSVHLCWEQRLRICIGAARGLEYLHTGTEYGVIHRDVKDTNILLDEHFVAKISDFGLSKLEELSESKSYMTTKVKGTYGYLDPEYHMTSKLTRNVDVYAFGVVMLVVLSGRPAVDVRNPGDSQSLLSSFRDCVTEGDFEPIIDPRLQGRILPSSLKEFVLSIENCLHHQPKKRPTMAQVARSLELALEQQEGPTISVTEVVAEMSKLSDVKDAESMQFSQSPPFPTKTDEAQLRENSSTVKKSIWGWPWKPTWNRGKPTKKADIVSSNGSSPHSSVDQQPYHLGPCFSNQDIQEAIDNLSDGNGRRLNSSDDFEGVDGKGRKASIGFMKQLEKPVIIYEFVLGHDRASDVFKEVEELSKLRHVNLQTLVGYSLDERENLKFVVYEHVGFESLDDHIYRRNGNPPLSWKCRLDICIAVAEGLAYLQECSGQAVNHRHLELANILLDKNWIPKISHVSEFLLKYAITQNFWGSPASGISITKEFQSGFEVREHSDLSSLGLLLVEVLFARRVNLEDCGGYFTSLRKSINCRTLHLTIDSSLRGEIAAKSLAEYLKTIFYCLLASMLASKESPASVVAAASKLKSALELQQKAESTVLQALEANEGSGSGFSLEDIYQEISPLDVILPKKWHPI